MASNFRFQGGNSTCSKNERGSEWGFLAFLLGLIRVWICFDILGGLHWLTVCDWYCLVVGARRPQVAGTLSTYWAGGAGKATQPATAALII